MVTESSTKEAPCQVSQSYRDRLAKLPHVDLKEPIVLTKELLDDTLEFWKLISQPIREQNYTMMNTILHSLFDVGLLQLRSWFQRYQQATGISSLGRNQIFLALAGWLETESALLQQACLSRKEDLAKILDTDSFQALQHTFARLFSLLSLSTTDQIVFLSRVTRLYDMRKDYASLDLVDTMFTFFGYPGAQFLYPLYMETAWQAAFSRLEHLRQSLEGPDCHDAYKAIRDWLGDATRSIGMEIHLPMTIPCDDVASKRP